MHKGFTIDVTYTYTVYNPPLGESRLQLLESIIRTNAKIPSLMRQMEAFPSHRRLH